jgi:hypothetical protein
MDYSSEHLSERLSGRTMDRADVAIAEERGSAHLLALIDLVDLLVVLESGDDNSVGRKIKNIGSSAHRVHDKKSEIANFDFDFEDLDWFVAAKSLCFSSGTSGIGKRYKEDIVRSKARLLGKCDELIAALGEIGFSDGLTGILQQSIERYAAIRR